MLIVSDALFVLVMALHAWFLVLEMVLWEKPLGRRTFGQTREQAAATAVLAKNQGLYNGFLAAGIAWALISGHEAEGIHLRYFFGACVAIAGFYGAVSTGKRTIILVQSLPALLALGALLAR